MAPVIDNFGAFDQTAVLRQGVFSPLQRQIEAKAQQGLVQALGMGAAQQEYFAEQARREVEKAAEYAMRNAVVMTDYDPRYMAHRTRIKPGQVYYTGESAGYTSQNAGVRAAKIYPAGVRGRLQKETDEWLKN